MTPVTDETMRRVAAALERLVLVIEARASSSSPRPVDPEKRWASAWAAWAGGR